ncbi:MAG: YbhN family protein [Calditrichia bacterium]
MPPQRNEKVSPPSTKNINRGIQGFILFTVLGLAFVIWWKTPAGLSYLFTHLNSPVMFWIIPLLLGDYLIGGFRYSLFFDGEIMPEISLWDSMRSNWANMFMGAVTPFQTGGGPAQLYILWRCGAKIYQGALISLINFGATLIFFQAASLIVILSLPPHYFGENATNIIRSGFIGIILFSGLVGLVLTFPALGYKLIEFVFRIIPPRLSRLHALKTRLLHILQSEISQFRDSFRLILRKKKKYLLIIVLATMVLFFNKYILGFVIASILSPGVQFKDFIGLQIIQYFLMYFAPTPGASGLAEISSTYLMDKIMETQVLVFYAVIFRFLTTVLGALIGGVVMIFDLKNWAKEHRAEAVVEND